MRCALTIAGSDSSGGAGIQADLKVFTALKVYGFCAVTAVTAQRADKVLAIVPVPADLVREQIAGAFEEASVQAVKIGMLATSQNLRAVVEQLRMHPDVDVALDPVLRASDGTELFDHQDLELLKNELIPLVTIITPNVPEAEALSGMKIETRDDMKKSASEIKSLGADYVLVKGGHLVGPPTDILYDGTRYEEIESDRIEGARVHGTGCLLSAAITALLAKEWEMRATIIEAKRLTHQWIENAIALRSGAGVLGLGLGA